ncbi:sporozoite-associated mosquito saliva protein 1-like [Onthophagus taurus]|uniref:sporozoite-associated mosquito saliva protein 1-like n=1 Tax=Onthophagus taurus TaxID=166361 RepID=UPI000C2017EC|nr:uncharacterized protein LOC111415529 [Onthophagus taurus]
MKVSRYVLCVFAITSCLFIKSTLSCNGYALKVNSIKNCRENNVIRLDETFSVTLDKNCNLIPKGCGVTKAFKTLNVKYTFTKPPMAPLEGTLNGCELMESNPTVGMLLSAFALPTKCPVKAQKICVNGDKTLSISKYRMQLGLIAGNMKLKIDGKHDTGNTCLLLDLSLNKK